MKIQVLAFASVAELLGADQLDLELAPGSRLSDLRRLLADRAPQLSTRGELAWAVDGALVRDDPELADGVEVAILPPVSGGAPSTRVSLVDGPIDLERAQAAVAGPGFGAVLLFLGTVRDHTARDERAGRVVEHLVYSAYRTMAQAKLETIVDELERAADAPLRVALVHRLGAVPVGAASVAIAVASPHREAAYEVSREALERLKREVPIWKREHYVDGAVAWREEEPLTPA
ncbi:MAG: molybdenum cofactor biosynthesis protein MoaE [Acidobacteriota bacterium]